VSAVQIGPSWSCGGCEAVKREPHCEPNHGGAVHLLGSMMTRRIGSGKRRTGSSNGGGTRTPCTGGIELHRRRGVGCPPIRPSSPSGLIESRHSSQVCEVDVFSPVAATDFPYAPWNRAGITQSYIGSHEPNIKSPPPTPIKIAATKSRRWRTTRGCGAHRSTTFGVGERRHWLRGARQRGIRVFWIAAGWVVGQNGGKP
jgi:hypothetical protein